MTSMCLKLIAFEKFYIVLQKVSFYLRFRCSKKSSKKTRAKPSLGHSVLVKYDILFTAILACIYCIYTVFTLFNTASSAAPQIAQFWRMLGFNRTISNLEVSIRRSIHARRNLIHI
jgi:hypothetical protein